MTCNINLKLTKKVPVKISATPNRLEKYMAFTIIKNLVFIGSMQFIISSLHALVKNLSDKDLKFLLQ